VLPRSGGDALGVVSRKDARAEGDSSSSPVSGLLLLLLLLRGVNHVVVLVFVVVGVVRLGLAVRACVLRRGTHEEGLLRMRVRVLHKECRRRDVLVGDVRGGT
jgi:hypothetical protein